MKGTGRIFYRYTPKCKERTTKSITPKTLKVVEKNDKWYAVVNPMAGSGKCREDWSTIESLLYKHQIEFDFNLTERKYHAVELTVSAINNGYRKILAVGGDGTLNEVVNGLFIQQRVDPSKITTGVIGVGTGNDWQRMFEIPQEYEGKVQSIKQENTVLQDVGKVSFYESGVQQTRYFANVAGVGFDAEVANSTNKLKEQGRRGKILYMLSLLKTLLKHRSSQVSISIDSKNIKAKTFSLTLGIGRFNGGGMMQVPNAIPDDGLFDITIIRHIKHWDVIRNIYRLYNGSILKHPKISGYQGTQISISSTPPINLEVDGESLGSSPFAFSILQKGIRVVVGSDYNAMASPTLALCTEDSMV